MPYTNDLKKGTFFTLNDEPYTTIDVSVQTPSARGGATLIKVKAKNLKTAQLIQKTFKAGEKLEDPNLETITCQYLYNENDEYYYFMDTTTYAQHVLNKNDISDKLHYIKENDEVNILLYNANPIGIDIPNTVILEVVDCEPAVKGDTVSSITKSATL